MKQPRHRRAYPPISPDSWGRLLEYLRQAERHLQDPRAPEPDIRLLADAEHGPFVGIVPGVDEDGRPTVYFQKAEGTTQPRHAPPLVVLLWRVHIAFGGGGHPNDAGNGLSYVKIGSGHCKVTIMRLVLDAKPGETVRQKRGAAFRNQDPRNFYKTTARTLTDGDGGSSRSHVTAYSLDRFRKHRMRSGIAISEAEYLDALRRVYAAIDATYLDG